MLSVSPLERMRSRGAIPPLKRGISAILPRYPMKARQMGAIPPSAILSRKGIARYGGVSRTGPLSKFSSRPIFLGARGAVGSRSKLMPKGPRSKCNVRDAISEFPKRKLEGHQQHLGLEKTGQSAQAPHQPGGVSLNPEGPTIKKI